MPSEAQGEAAGDAGFRHAAAAAHPLEPGFEEGAARSLAAIEQAEVHGHEPDAVEVEAGREGARALELAEEEARSREQHERQRYLETHESPPSAGATAHEPAAPELQDLDHVEARGAEGGAEAGSERGQQGHPRRERGHPEIRAQVEMERDRELGEEGVERGGRRAHEEGPPRPAEAEEQEGLREHGPQNGQG